MTTPPTYDDRIAALREAHENAGIASEEEYEATELLFALASELAEKLTVAEGNYRFMVENAASVKLDGYRDLGERVAKAEAERDGLKRAVDDHLLEAASLAADNLRLQEQLDAERAAKKQLAELQECEQQAHASTKRELEQERGRNSTQADSLREYDAEVRALRSRVVSLLSRLPLEERLAANKQHAADMAAAGLARCSKCGGTGRVWDNGDMTDCVCRNPVPPVASEEPVLCGIPGTKLLPCELEWGHDGDMHSYGDAPEHAETHARRQVIRKQGAEERCTVCGTVAGSGLADQVSNGLCLGCAVEKFPPGRAT